MNDATANNVMWAAEIIADQSGMYAGFFTHMDADQGKYGASAQKTDKQTALCKARHK